ncbi:hypothetical protein G6F35_016945 [Rhizopus arrhizus]|nr:hypothetical protein G6F35_016945 [Rhizopus arrhizus]
MGELPSQHPPDWWNIKGPCLVRKVSISLRASSVATTRGVCSVMASFLSGSAGAPGPKARRAGRRLTIRKSPASSANSSPAGSSSADSG